MWKDADKPDQSQTLLIDIPNVEASDLTEQEKQDLIDLPNLSESEIKAINRRFEPYIFFKKIKNNDYECFCTHCNSTYYDDQEHYHKTPELCRNCGTTCLEVSANYPQKNKTESMNFVIFKRAANKVYALCIWVSKIYDRKQFRTYNGGPLKLNRDFLRQPDLYAGVNMIYVFKPGEYKAYAPEWVYKIHGYVYRKVKKKLPKPFRGAMYQTPSMIYLRRQVLYYSHLRYYCEAFPYGEAPKDDKFIRWLCLCSYAPMAEIAIKSDSPTLRQIIHDRLRYDSTHFKLVNWKAKRPKDFLKIPYSDLKKYGKHLTDKGALGAVDLSVLETYALHFKKGEKVSFDLCEFENVLTDNRSLPNYMNVTDIMQVKELFEYKMRQVKNGTWHSLYTYADYLNHAKDCGYDLTQRSIRYPRDLRQAHDDAVANWQIIQAEKEKAKAEAEAKKYGYPERYKKLCKKFAFEYGDLMIVVPERASEIITEGKVLQHCVGSYASRHIQGKTTILFLRHISEPDKPYYTIEVNEKEKYIVQCHGFMNEWKSKKAEEVKAFEKEFAKFIKNPQKYKAERKEEPCRKKSA